MGRGEGRLCWTLPTVRFFDGECSYRPFVQPLSQWQLRAQCRSFEILSEPVERRRKKWFGLGGNVGRCGRAGIVAEGAKISRSFANDLAVNFRLSGS